MKFLSMHITNQKLSFDIYSRKFTKYLKWNMIFLLNILMNFEPYNVLLAIATNISMLLMTGFVVQGHK